MFDGELTPEQIADEWPDIYLRHAKKLEDAERRGDALREAKVAERREAERRAEADAEEARILEFWAAAETWEKSPDGQVFARKKAEREAAEKAAAEALWPIAFVAMDNGITGDAEARRVGVATLLGGEPTRDACIDFLRDDFGWSATRSEEEIDTLRRDVATQNSGSLGAWLHIGDPDERAYKYLLELKRCTERYPDLYQFRPKPVNPGGCIPSEWFKTLKSTNTNKKEK